ncbi:hypothetical protein [Marivirga sp.]|uniref:hypothetical protein n=1 Tax=Marivirga sp. TaxID=2018662 RepID=UPI003DA75AE7
MLTMQMDEALDVIDSGQKFSATFCTADENRKTGGEIIHYDDIQCDGHYYPDPIRKFNLPNKRTITVHLFLIKDINGHRLI